MPRSTPPWQEENARVRAFLGKQEVAVVEHPLEFGRNRHWLMAQLSLIGPRPSQMSLVRLCLTWPRTTFERRGSPLTRLGPDKKGDLLGAA
jgi:hypothetical protein